MRVEFSEEAMYRRMDQKDRMITMVPICGILGFFGVFLVAAGYEITICLPVIMAALIGAVGCGYGYRKWKRLIMPVSRCFLEIEGTCFSIIQPFIDGTYESGRIYLEEVECLIREKRTDGFYLQIKPGGRSVIQDGTGKKRTNCHISAFGYSKETMDEVYGRIKERLTKTAEVYQYEK